MAHFFFFFLLIFFLPFSCCPALNSFPISFCPNSLVRSVLFRGLDESGLSSSPLHGISCCLTVLDLIRTVLSSFPYGYRYVIPLQRWEPGFKA